MKKRIFFATATILFTFFNIAYAAGNSTQKVLAYFVAMLILGAALFCTGWSIKKLIKHTQITPDTCIWIGTFIIATILFISILVF
ncbi:hypothetical protein K8R30_04955 [archaeon]|nr:hypothetical protein [archaeon]